MRAKPTIKAGSTFGRWTALEDAPKARRSRVLCRCECGTERAVEARNLQEGISKSCGCLRAERVRKPRALAYIKIGDTSGRLTALEAMDGAKGLVKCRCECGTATSVRAVLFKHGRTKSCGCLVRDLRATRNVTHGMRHHPLYGSWHSMMGRCFNPNQSSYPDYGGRGITVCERWRSPVDGILNFATDMGPKPGPVYSVERRDVNGHYEPGNCRWATPKEQAANVRPRARQADLRALQAENRQLRERVAELETLACTHSTPTSVAATPGNWVSCGVCHDQRLIRSVSRAAPLRLVQGELWTVEELTELEEAA